MEINSNLNIRFILSCKHFSGEVQYYMFENLKSQISKLFLPWMLHLDASQQEANCPRNYFHMSVI